MSGLSSALVLPRPATTSLNQWALSITLEDATATAIATAIPSMMARARADRPLAKSNAKLA